MRKLLIVVAGIAFTGAIAWARMAQIDPLEMLPIPRDLPAVSAAPEVTAMPTPAAPANAAPSLVDDGNILLGDGPPDAAEVAEARRNALVEASLQQMHDPDEGVRTRAIEELARQRSERAVDALRVVARRDASGSVRRAAIGALVQLGAADSVAEIAAEPGLPTDDKLAALDGIDDLEPTGQDPEEVDPWEKATVPWLMDALNDPDPDVYEEAASMLEDVDPSLIVGDLWSKFFSDAETNFDRAQVILDLLEYHDEEVDEAREYLDYVDPTPWAALAQARALACRTDPNCRL